MGWKTPKCVPSVERWECTTGTSMFASIECVTTSNMGYNKQARSNAFLGTFRGDMYLP